MLEVESELSLPASKALALPAVLWGCGSVLSCLSVLAQAPGAPHWTLSPFSGWGCGMAGSTGVQPGVPGLQGLRLSYVRVTRLSFISIGWFCWDLEKVNLCDSKGRTRQGMEPLENSTRGGLFPGGLGRCLVHFLRASVSSYHKLHGLKHPKCILLFGRLEVCN